MAQIISTQSNSESVVNTAVGSIVTDAGAAAAASFNVGFAPRRIAFHNLTDRISDEWYEGIDFAAILTSIRGITAKLDADAGVTDTNFGALWNPSSINPYALVASIAGILAKLDLDAGVTDTNYAALWTPVDLPFTSLRAALVGMNAKLDADAGVTDTNYGSLWNPAATFSLQTVAAGTRTLETTNGIVVSGNTFTVTAGTLLASKQFAWVAEG